MICRIAVTLKCNLSCPYCIMKDDAIVKSFKPASLEEILKKNYDSYAITGGEPLTDPVRLSELLEVLKGKKRPVYLYSNGKLLTREFLIAHQSLITSVNIGAHGDIDRDKIVQLNELVSVRLHRWERLVDPELIEFCSGYGIKLKSWKMDDCKTQDDERFLLLD
jgi:organic radical activating enzyme